MKQYQLTPDKFLTDLEVEALKIRLATLSERDSLYFETLLATGGRASEILGLTASSLVLDGHGVFISGMKDSNDRTIPVRPELFERLKALAAQSNGLLFPFGLRNADRIWRLVRPVQKKLHSTRHTFAITLYRKSRDIKIVQFALGHRNIRNTLIYTEIDQTDDLRKILIAS